MRNPSEYLKMRVLGAIDMAEGDKIRDRIKSVSQMTFTDEDGNLRSFTWRTIETWRCRYNKHGVTALTPNPRKDIGAMRKVSLEQVQEAIDAVLPSFRKPNPKKAAIYRACIEQGLLLREKVAPNTFNRIVNKYEMLKPEKDCTNKRRLAFAKAHANEMWQADTMFGPFVKNGSTMTQAKLIAFIDDASRLCVHGEFFFKDDVDSLIEALSSAFYKRGIPECLYVDNGSNYTSKEIVQICARVGTILSHTPVRDGAAKGKVERFFKTCREQFLIMKLDLSSINALNRQFATWVEEKYNANKHSVLGMTPLDRFALDRRRVRYLPPNEVNEELFFVEDDRVVKADNTFSFKGGRYETPRHLASRKVQVRYKRSEPHKKVVVFYKGERMGTARLLDMIANDRPSRKATARMQTCKEKGE